MRSLLGPRLALDWRIAFVTVVSTLLLMGDAYHRITPVKAYDRLILYLVIPLALILVAFREPLGQYGLGLGDWKAGLLLTLGGLVIITPILWLTARAPAMQKYYESQLPGLPWTTFLDLVGWEFFFRGFILFTYTRKFGADGLWLQAVPFALAHIGKPEVETFSTIFGGFAFGWLAFRTRSFLYPFLLHWYVATFTVLVAAGVLG